MNGGDTMMKLILNKADYKICPKCLRVFPKDCNYCPDEEELVPLVEFDVE